MSFRRCLLRTSGALAMATFLGWNAGCSAVPEVRYYELTPPTAEPTPTATSSEAIDTLNDGLWLGVEELTVDPPYDQDRLVYRLSATSAEVGFYEFTRWAAPLGQMLQGDLVTSLEGQKGLRGVEPAVAGRVYDVLLRGRVLRVEQVDRTDGTIDAYLSISWQVADSTGRPRCRGEVDGEAQGMADDGDGVMTLMSQAASRALSKARQKVSSCLEVDS